MKVLAGGELRHGAPGLDFVADSEAGRDVVGGAVRYPTMHPDIATAVVGMASPEELARNVMAVDGVDDTQFSCFCEWTRKSQELGHGECTRCGACLDACPESIEIPKIFRLYDQMRFLKMDGVARYKYRMMEVDASACLRCRKCQEVCPENFDIGASLDAAHRTLATFV
jgi:hypothetical protein